MPSYTCLCCEHTETFESADAAFQAGWDVAPHFTMQPLCNLCPAAPVVLFGLDVARARHASRHDAWRRDGRPREFGLASELSTDVTAAADVEEQTTKNDGLKKPFDPGKH